MKKHLIARYADGIPARRGDVLVPATATDTVDFLAPASKGTPSRPATVWVRGMERYEVPAAVVGLVVSVEEVAA